MPLVLTFLTHCVDFSGDQREIGSYMIMLIAFILYSAILRSLSSRLLSHVTLNE